MNFINHLLLTLWAIIAPHDLRIEFGERTEIITIEGKLLATPKTKIHEIDDQTSWRTAAQIEVSGYRKNEKWHPAFGKIFVTTPGVLSGNFSGGQTVEVTGVIAPPKFPVAEGLFDYKTY